MKIEFVDADTTIGRVSGIYLPINDIKNEIVAGHYCYEDKKMIIVRQRYWYITVFVLVHESLHAIINFIFPYQKGIPEYYGKCHFDRDKNNKPILEHGIYLNTNSITRKFHPWHDIVDKYLKMPEKWRENPYLRLAFKKNRTPLKKIIKEELNKE